MVTTAATEEELRARLTEIETLGRLDEALKSRLLETYRSAIAFTKEAREHEAALERFRSLATTAPEETRRIREALETPMEPVAPPPADADLETLKALVAQEQGELQALRTELAERETTLGAQTERPTRAREAIALARTKLDEIEKELRAPRPEEDDPVVAEARVALLAARRRARSAEVAALEQELAIFPSRLALLNAQRDQSARLIAASEERLKILQAALAEAREEAVLETQRAAERARREAIGKHPLVRSLAETNATLVEDLAEITRLAESKRAAADEIHETLVRFETDFEAAKKRYEQLGLSPMLGELFLEARRTLPNLSRRRPSEDEEERFSRLSVRHFRLEERLRRTADVAATAAELAASATEPVAGRATLEEELRTLLAKERDIISQYSEAFERYSRALVDLEFESGNLAAQVRAYTRFLDERLLWTPSSPVVGTAFLERTLEGLRWLASPARYRELITALASGVSNRPLIALGGLLGLLALVAFRRPLRRHVRNSAQRISRRRSESVHWTITALLAVIALSAALPLLMATAGGTLAAARDPSDFARAAAPALMNGALLVFLLLLLQRIPPQVGEPHFRWPQPLVRKLVRHLRWFLPVLIASVLLTWIAEEHGSEDFRNGFGRASFVVGRAAVLVFIAIILAPWDGALAVTRLAAQPLVHRFRWILWLLALLVPLVLVGLALAGYMYTALALDYRLAIHVAVVAGILLGYHVALRWLFAARIRLAYERLKEKREAEANAPELLEVFDEVDPAAIDMDKIREQTGSLVDISAIAAILVTTAIVWVPVLPALRVFDVEIWSVTRTVAGEDRLLPITIGSLFFAVLYLVLTTICARNLPGFLEVAILRRLPLEPGSRYAVSTISQYVLVAIGLFLAFGALGFHWAQVQWLVAALSVGLGFGLQEIFANFVSGIILLLERPIRVGDTVTIGEVSGTVSRIRIRATTIVDWDQKELIVPNRRFITESLVNWSLSSPVTRVIVPVGIAYGSDTERAVRLMLQVAENHSRVLEEPEPTVLFVRFGNSSLDFEVRVFVKETTNRARSRIVHDLHMGIDRAFRAHGVVIAFPQLDLHVQDVPALEVRDRAGTGGEADEDLDEEDLDEEDPGAEDPDEAEDERPTRRRAKRRAPAPPADGPRGPRS